MAPTYTSEGYTIYKCETCDETEKRDVVPMLVPESNGSSSAVTLTVTGAGAYETSMADGRYIIAVPAENAVLSGCLGNLKELKAQGVNTLVFRTQLRETALNHRQYAVSGRWISTLFTPHPTPVRAQS